MWKVLFLIKLLIWLNNFFFIITRFGHYWWYTVKQYAGNVRHEPRILSARGGRVILHNIFHCCCIDLELSSERVAIALTLAFCSKLLRRRRDLWPPPWISSSCPPPHIIQKDPFPTVLPTALPLRRIFSDHTTFYKLCDELAEHLKKRGSKEKLIQREINKAKQVPCDKTNAIKQMQPRHPICCHLQSNP